MKNKIKDSLVTASGFAYRFIWYFWLVISSLEFYNNYLIGAYADIPDISFDSIVICCALVFSLFDVFISFMRNCFHKFRKTEVENMTSEEFEVVSDILSGFAQTGMMCIDERQSDLIKKYAEIMSGEMSFPSPSPHN